MLTQTTPPPRYGLGILYCLLPLRLPSGRHSYCCVDQTSDDQNLVQINI